MDRLTSVWGTCNGENIYGTAEAKIKTRKELEESGEIKNPEALDYFTNIRFENKLITKLGKLEDIEEELGIDLIKFFDRIWLPDKDNKNANHPFPIKTLETLKKNYGKTWAATKEELEKQL